ncbi:MAG: hypothetical protein IKT27_03035 [Clostridia bacterium]|nr:hypothetical protein [Clostridia bacterium]
MNKEFTIYTRWLALALRQQGFRIIRTEVNEFHPQFDTYVFENCEDLQIAISQLTKRKH